MKTLVINILAGWVANVRSFVDGDIFRESNIDLSMGDVADRLGYLKAQVDASGKLAGTNVWSGVSNTFANEIFAFAATFSGSVAFEDAVVIQDVCQVEGEVEFVQDSLLKISGSHTLPDAPLQITQTIARVPTLTANRAYDPPAASDGRLLFFARPRTADAFTATLTGLGVIPISQAGWIIAWCDGATWKVLAASNNVTGLPVVP